MNGEGYRYVKSSNDTSRSKDVLVQLYILSVSSLLSAVPELHELGLSITFFHFS